MLLSKEIKCLLGYFACLGHPDLMNGFFGSRLNRLGHVVQDVTRFVKPATLLPSLRVSLAKCGPKTQRTIPDRKLRVLSQATVLQICQQLRPTRFTLPEAI